MRNNIISYKFIIYLLSLFICLYGLLRHPRMKFFCSRRVCGKETRANVQPLILISNYYITVIIKTIELKYLPSCLID